MDNINIMTDQEIHQRAHNKVWSRIQNCNITILANREDIKHKRFGKLEPEDLEQILEGNKSNRDRTFCICRCVQHLENVECFKCCWLWSRFNETLEKGILR